MVLKQEQTRLDPFVSNLFGLDLRCLEDVTIADLHHLRQGTQSLSVELEEEAVSPESRVDDESSKLQQHVARATTGERIELCLQKVNQLAVVRNVCRFCISFLRFVRRRAIFGTQGLNRRFQATFKLQGVLAFPAVTLV